MEQKHQPKRGKEDEYDDKKNRINEVTSTTLYRYSSAGAAVIPPPLVDSVSRCSETETQTLRYSDFTGLRREKSWNIKSNLTVRSN